MHKSLLIAALLAAAPVFAAGKKPPVHAHQHGLPTQKLSIPEQKNAKDAAARGGAPTIERILPIQYSCGPSLRIRAQELTAAQLNDTCAKLGVQESYFHQRLATGYVPVANDYNDDLELVIFNNYDQYKRYAGRFYGISTNNGGMYLEGNPADPNNQARFIAYEADWLPSWQIWNLEHEYNHYLDGRFDLYGDFELGMTAATVWWSEGLAEFLALKNTNPDAIAAARTHAYSLSTIFANTYSSGTERIYDWGYLAVRFAFERHPEMVNDILGYFRAGQYSVYTGYMNSLGAAYDAEFDAWLDTVQ
ncbi:MAG: collagenase [Gammaproteobacteria bacterium]|nr:collagenase [Gammaproteobacteria bacterium]